MAPRTGLSARIDLVVTEGDTALALGSGSVEVLATPRLIALCEEASCRAIDDHLAAGATSVAKRVQFDHLVPVGVGGEVSAEATLDRIQGRRLIFTVSVSEGGSLVAAGRLVRVIVDRSDFLVTVR